MQDMQDLYYFEAIPLTQEDIALFNDATFYLYGSVFQPIAVARRKISSAQYRYLSLIMPKYATGSMGYTIVDVYKPISGRPYVTKIAILDINKI